MKPQVLRIPLTDAALFGDRRRPQLKFAIRKDNKPALCFLRTTQADCVYIDSTRIRSKTITGRMFKSGKSIPHNGSDYTPEHFIEVLREVNQTKPITKKALNLLCQIDPDLINDFQVEIRKPGKTIRGDTVLDLAEEFNITPRKIRKLLRKQGLSAPYDDFEGLKKILSSPGVIS